MRVPRQSVGAALAVVASVVMEFDLSQPWYQVTFPSKFFGPGDSFSMTAHEALSATPGVLSFISVFVISIYLIGSLRSSRRSTRLQGPRFGAPQLAGPAAVAVMVGGVAALAITGYRTIAPPQSLVDSPARGIWIGLGAATGILAGGLLSLSRPRPST
jgi:hypothetical protein